MTNNTDKKNDHKNQQAQKYGRDSTDVNRSNRELLEGSIKGGIH
jgi:hypothetical protein